MKADFKTALEEIGEILVKTGTIKLAETNAAKQLAKIKTLLDNLGVPDEVCIGKEQTCDRVDWVLRRMYGIDPYFRSVEKWF